MKSLVKKQICIILINSQLRLPEPWVTILNHQQNKGIAIVDSTETPEWDQIVNSTPLMASDTYFSGSFGLDIINLHCVKLVCNSFCTPLQRWQMNHQKELGTQ